MGEGPRGSNGACSTLHWISVTPSATHNQTGPLWCWFPSAWACARPRPLWVSPAAALTPMGVFDQRFEALFPCAGALGYMVCFTPHRSSRFICAQMWGCRVLPTALPAPFSVTLSQALSVYLCENVGPQGLLVLGLPAPSSHTPPVSVPPRECESSPPRVPISAPPTGLDECLFFISLVSNFLAVQFSISSGCARRPSVSTYAAILVLLI